MLLIILHLIPDADDPYGIVTTLIRALPAGSYLVLAHPASDIRAAEMAEMTERVNQRMTGPQATMRDRAAITRFFDGLELLEPGVVQPQRWRPEPGVLARLRWSRLVRSRPQAAGVTRRAPVCVSGSVRPARRCRRGRSATLHQLSLTRSGSSGRTGPGRSSGQRW